mgnify:FL=1|tara:strand:+ start:157 stop:888 length:732 start_codon:yes stop_codon:yes gene_type:complete
MRKIIIGSFLIASIGLAADGHLPPGYSKYQSNFLFSCLMPSKCLEAFNKYMNAPEIKSQNFEADMYAVLHNGWDEATHGVSFYYKSADEYAKGNQLYVTSEAGRKFRKRMRELDIEATSQNLTVHTVGVTNSGTAADNVVSLRWSLEVSNPAKFVPLWMDFSKSIEKYNWSANAYGLQSHYLGNNGRITHEIWAAFSDTQGALAFLDGMYNSKEFAEYNPKADEHSDFIRSYMEVSLSQFNPD